MLISAKLDHPLLQVLLETMVVQMIVTSLLVEMAVHHLAQPSAPIWLLLVLYGRRWRHLFPAKPGQAKPNHLLLTSIHPLHCATLQLDPLHYSKLQLLIRRRALITPSPGVPHIHYPTR